MIRTESKYSWVTWEVEIRSITSKLEYRTWEEGMEAEERNKVEMGVCPFQQNLHLLPAILNQFLQVTPDDKAGAGGSPQVPPITIGKAHRRIHPLQ